MFVEIFPSRRAVMSTKANKPILEKARGFGGAVVEHLAVEAATQAIMCLLPCCSALFVGVPIAKLGWADGLSANR
jgi:hypothetical protein